MRVGSHDNILHCDLEMGEKSEESIVKYSEKIKMKLEV